MPTQPQLIESVLAQHISHVKRIWDGIGKPHSYSLHSGEKKSERQYEGLRPMNVKR